MLIPLLLTLTSIVSLDSFPSLHTLPDKDIASVTGNFDNDHIIVTMNNGAVYDYPIEQWDLEETYSETSDRVKKSIDNVKKVFTKVESPAEFPGGADAWDHYIDSFCIVHKKEIRKAGPGEVTVQCIVHARGQLTNITLVSQPEDRRLGQLAIQAVKESPQWNPARQHGHLVIAYRMIEVMLK